MSPWRTTREWVPPTCLRCGGDITERSKRPRKWCGPCREWARLAHALTNALRTIELLPSTPDLAELAAQIQEGRERLNIGEDLFPLDGQGMSVAEYARRSGTPRDAIRHLRGAGVRR